MSTEESILGFGNRWYSDMLRTAHRYSLPSGNVIRRTVRARSDPSDAFRTFWSETEGKGREMHTVIPGLNS